ncbi:hypothetical protein OPV22_028994 [Ensete ventricosum]|uniref:Secreted protein n=1 Tax=Ensete ventricosum TaxID=4639 RepID=A0AAV8P4L9_ENSVE|nr:hypothetical protein OPV22_034709 [Ensete ventricosum]KAJ8466442.1 hypothetical protein OPV22_028994 [Ensete ventricosum]
MAVAASLSLLLASVINLGWDNSCLHCSHKLHILASKHHHKKTYTVVSVRDKEAVKASSETEGQRTLGIRFR